VTGPSPGEGQWVEKFICGSYIATGSQCQWSQFMTCVFSMQPQCLHSLHPVASRLQGC